MQSTKPADPVSWVEPLLLLDQRCEFSNSPTLRVAFLLALLFPGAQVRIAQ